MTEPKDEGAPESGHPFQDDWNTLKPGFPLERLPEEDVRKFVLDFLAGQIFTSAQVRGGDPTILGMVFMPVFFGTFSAYNPQSLEDIGILWEYMDRAGPRSINGYPIFTSMRVMHRLDWERAKKAIVREQERQKAIEIPPDEI